MAATPEEEAIIRKRFLTQVAVSKVRNNRIMRMFPALRTLTFCSLHLRNFYGDPESADQC